MAQINQTYGRIIAVIELTLRGPVAWARFDRADKLNAMPRSFWGDLEEVVRRVESDAAIRALVFHGAGKAFSVGGDLDGFGGLADVALREAARFVALAA